MVTASGPSNSSEVLESGHCAAFSHEHSVGQVVRSSIELALKGGSGEAQVVEATVLVEAEDERQNGELSESESQVGASARL